jgi:hypothetical protein
MKSSIIPVFLIAAAEVCSASDVFQRNCDGNNCAREVTGTRAGLLPVSSRQADCSSFQLTTVIPRPECELPTPRAFIVRQDRRMTTDHACSNTQHHHRHRDSHPRQLEEHGRPKPAHFWGDMRGCNHHTYCRHTSLRIVVHRLRRILVCVLVLGHHGDYIHGCKGNGHGHCDGHAASVR